MVKLHYFNMSWYLGYLNLLCVQNLNYINNLCLLGDQIMNETSLHSVNNHKHEANINEGDIRKKFMCTPT